MDRTAGRIGGLRTGTRLPAGSAYSGGNQSERRWASTSVFPGRSGSGRLQTAEGLANALDMALLVIDLPSLLEVDRNLEWSLQPVFRTSLFENAIVYFSDFDHLRAEEQRLNLRRFWDAVLEDRGISIFAGSQPWEPVAQQTSGVIPIRFALPSYERRFWIWTDELAKSGSEANPADLQAVAARFRLAPAQIAEATLAAAHQKQIEIGSADPEAEQDLTIGREMLFDAARKQSGHELAKLARLIEPRYAWDDLRLPPNSKQQLLEIVQRVELREKVLVEMGFGEKHVRGRGVTVLFAGPSGTGKTMAAEVIAKQLGLDLYRIDLSSVISKYIGETEKIWNKSSWLQRRPMPSCFSTRQMHSSASAQKYVTRTTGMPISKSLTCCKRWKTTMGCGSWPPTCGKTWMSRLLVA